MLKKKFLTLFICLVFIVLLVQPNVASATIIDKNGQVIPSFYFSSCEAVASSRSTGSIYESESNNSKSTADRTYDGYDSYGKISIASDVDWWVVQFSNNGYVDFWLGNIPSGCDYDMKLYASDGTTLLKSAMLIGNGDELIQEYWVSGGTDYYIRINAYSGSSSSSYYTFKANYHSYHQYAGFVVGGENKGINAIITTPSRLPDVSDSGESVWVSTSKDANSQWIQAGARYYSSFTAFEIYTEHFSNGVYLRSNEGTHALGASLPYKVEYNSSDNRWHAYISGSDKISSTLATVNNSVQANAEVHKKEIEMGPFNFSNVLIKNSNGIWIPNTVLPSASSPYSVTGTATNFTVTGP